MCMSPHEMTSARIEEVIENYKKYAEDERKAGDLYSERYYLGHVESFLKVLKERAEDGTYDSAGYKSGDRSETQRTAYQGV